MNNYLGTTELCITVNVDEVRERVSSASPYDPEYFEDDEYCIPAAWRRSTTERIGAGQMQVHEDGDIAWIFIYPEHPHWGGANLIEIDARARAEWLEAFDADIALMEKDKEEEAENG